MTILFIIPSILYLIMVYSVLSLYYTTRKFKEEIEDRLLQLEKRETLNTKYLNNCLTDLYDMINEKEGDNMACKKGRGGRKK